MKKAVYIICFGVFGLLVATLIHAVLEMIALAIIFGNPAQFSETFWWHQWCTIHLVVSIILWVVGLALGLYAGKRFWKIVYVEKHAAS